VTQNKTRGALRGSEPLGCHIPIDPMGKTNNQPVQKPSLLMHITPNPDTPTAAFLEKANKSFVFWPAWFSVKLSRANSTVK
jgi:hypothetical protein